MQSIFDQINQWLKDFLIGSITGNLANLFDDVNTKVGEIANQVGQTPSGWNGGVCSMIQNISETVIIPIAGMILAFVMTYELIQMVIERNNMHEIDTFMFFKWVFKTFVAVMIVTHTFDMVMAVFDVAQHVVQGSAGVIDASASIDITAVTANLETTLQAMEIPELFGLTIESMLISVTMKIMSMCIFVIVYGRMIEIYLYCSLGPIPLSTLANREWGQMGTNYIRALFALGFQGFLILICVGIYAVLVNTIAVGQDIHAAIWGCAGYTLLLCFSLFKTGSLAKSIFNAH
ncbi:MAG: CD0415/CD1112 family protein [Oscillospiraceae bacterium]|nr:CD0415/CD1112 family protein [Oscillospiraceae bacterium]